MTAFQAKMFIGGECSNRGRHLRSLKIIKYSYNTYFASSDQKDDHIPAVRTMYFYNVNYPGKRYSGVFSLYIYVLWWGSLDLIERKNIDIVAFWKAH